MSPADNTFRPVTDFSQTVENSPDPWPPPVLMPDISHLLLATPTKMTRYSRTDPAPVISMASDSDPNPTPDPGLTYMTLRLPRGLLQDLEETIIQQDRQFLTEVGLSMGLSRPEVAAMIRRVLGTGAPQTIPVLWAPPETANTDDDEDEPRDNFCPWWECRGEGLWRRCPRHRISPHLPCPIHERSVPCPLTRLNTDPFIQALPALTPMEFNGRLFWTLPDNQTCYAEDGSLPTDGAIRFVWSSDGERIPVWFPITVLEALRDQEEG
jgi:hypothetical protein